MSGLKGRILRAGVGIVAVVATTLGLQVPAMGAQTWAAVPSPNLSGIAQQNLRGVSCVSTTFCVAVGSYRQSSANGPQMLIEMWNGTTWSIPQGSGAPGELTSVSCASASFCMAVGNAGPFSFSGTASWDGTTWTVKDTSLSIDFEPQSVSCASTTACTAVGTSSSNHAEIVDGGGSPWNWRVNYEPSTGPESHFEGVSCVTATTCTVVGWTTDGTTKHSLAASYTGFFLTTTPTLDVSTGDSMLHGVSCVSANRCVAVGEAVQVATPVFTSQSSPVVQTWDGMRWLPTPVQPSLTNNGDFLTSVSCASPSSCTAVGYSVPNKTLVEHWDGLAWRIQTSPNATTGVLGDTQLRGVSCGSSTACTAVGYYTDGKTEGLIETGRGSAWSLTPHPQQPATVDVLHGVSCPASDRCAAVGEFIGADAIPHSLIETWDGTAWSVIPANGAQLNGVSCVSSDWCMAVGAGAIQLWNGSTWSDVADPTPLGRRLFGVSCVSTTMCAAVGNGDLTEMWNGSVWSVVPSPQTGSFGNLRGVSCSSAVSCVAVGDYSVRSDFYTPQTLVESWDGTSWTLVASPNPGSLQNSFSSVSCVSPIACTATGYTLTNQMQPLIASWDGTTWTPVSMQMYGSLAGVSCVAADSCTAVGFDGTTNGTLILSGGSAGWSVVPANSPPADQSGLQGVTCDASGSCTAVGVYHTNGESRTLVERST